MYVNEHDKNQIIELINNARNIAIMPAITAGADSFSAATGIYHMLSQKHGSQKNIKFVYFGDTPNACENLIENKEISSNLSERDLIISVDYSDTPASKISYSTEDDVFYLKMGPISKDFDTKKIKARITGFNFDLIITVGARELADLGQIYENLNEEINRAKIVNVDTSADNKRFGIVNVVDVEADSLSTLVFKSAGEWGLTPNKDSAKALLTGITYRNNNQ
jgi:nanoRNase/pAp phosphatase (c-di-AMP/oligoRNAs hydrolase)